MTNKIYLYGISALALAVLAIMFLRYDTSKPLTDFPEEKNQQEFTVKYPEGYKVYSTAPDVITVENEAGQGFQIAVTAFDESGPITPERIQQDLPDAEINEPGLAKLDGEQTLVFYGYDEDIGETFEAWVVHNGKLYQIMSAKSDENMLESLLDTWKWSE